MVEDIITGLSRVKWIFVIARNSSFANSRVVPSVVHEDRLLANVRRVLGPQVSELREPPILPDDGFDRTATATRVGVPVIPFPQWLRCTACDRLGRLEEGSLWNFVNRVPSRPDLARFIHGQCPKSRRDPIAVPARFVLACPAGHLDEFPWVSFVHKDKECQEGSAGRLTMEDRAGNVGPNVIVRCECGARRNMLQAIGAAGAQRLPRCRGRHPHLGVFDSECPRATEVRTLVLGASNQWFAVSVSALHLPSRAQGLAAEVERLWPLLREVDSEQVLQYALRTQQELVSLRVHDVARVWKAIEEHRSALQSGSSPGPTDLRVAEYVALTDPEASTDSEDFTIRSSSVRPPADRVIEQVVLVERLRVARAFVGFTRLDAPEWGKVSPDGMVRVSNVEPTWVPATQTRGEGIFIRLREDVLRAWVPPVNTHPHVEALEAAYGRFRANRKLDPRAGWPGARYLLLHTLSHMLIRQMSLECGYSSASLAERIYHDLDGSPAAGILIYTAASDSEGTLGGLVALGEPARLASLISDAIEDGKWCSSDPLCAEREPVDPEEFIHGAACHACLFLSETTCERGNRFLDRSLVVPLDRYPELAVLSTA